MSALLGILAAIYGGSLVVIAGGGVLFAISARFRREVRDDSQPF